MSSLIYGFAASAFYLASLGSHLNALREGDVRPRALRLAMLLAVPALLLHLTTLVLSILLPDGIDLGLFNTASLVFWAIAAIAYVASWRMPVTSLLVVVYPLTVIALLTALFLHSPYVPRLDLGWGIGLHILLSIFAYSILSIAAVQAAALGLIIRQLKHSQFHGLLDRMPPMQTMEDLLFRLIWTGEILLGLAILSGTFFLENMFAQHLVHKTVLSIVGWLVFAILLWGRHQLGWRGKTAIKWTLSGFGLLVLAFFGTKVVLELILHRSAG